MKRFRAMKAVGALLVAVAVAHATAPPASPVPAAASGPAAHLPRSYYRFEDATDLMKDSAPAALHLQPKGEATRAAKTQGEGGLVGGWMQVDGCGDNWNRSLVANASQLPRQCVGSGHYCNPNFPCPGQPGGKVGGCCCNTTNDPQGQITGVTIEFLIKLGRCAKLNGNLTLFDTGGGPYGGGSRIWIDLSRHGFSFRMEANRGDKALVQASANGTGRASTQYLHDDQWHHIVVRRSTGGLAGEGKLDAWIDGQVPLSVDQWFSRPAPNPRPASWPWALSGIKPGGYFGSWMDGKWPSLMMLPSSFDGGIDEVALYEEALPDALIVQHYNDAMAHKPYSSTVADKASAVTGSTGDDHATPPADPKPALDDREYPPGTLLPTPACTDCGNPHCAEMPTTGVKLSPLAQLQSYPLPRYQKTIAPGTYPLQKLGNCMESGYLGGENQANTSVINMPCPFSCNHTTHVCNGSVGECVTNATMKIKYELGTRWNYLLVVGGCANASDPDCGWTKPRACREGMPDFMCASEQLQTINMINDNPEIGGAEFYMRRGNNPNKTIGSLNSGPTSNCDGNQSLPKSCYLQNASGHFIDYAGKGANCTGCSTKCKQPRLLVADSSRAKYCPDALFAAEGDFVRPAIAALAKLLKNPLVRVWNDGEQFNGEGARVGSEMDPVMVEDYIASGITSRYGPNCAFTSPGQTHENATECRDWFSHVSAWRAGFASRWRDYFLEPSPTTKYGEYLIAGTQAGTGNWTFMRQIMSAESVDGKRTGRLGAMHYSKASIYPGASGPGGYDTGWMGGLDTLEMYVPSQIKAGDEIFSPFVAAGWESAVEKNMRPAQWLGFLKIMTALGAEYVETGFFTPLVFSAKWKNVQLPQNYVWQAAAPAYAQATLSLWSDLLFNGHLVDPPVDDGGMPSPAVAEDCGYKGCDMQTQQPGQSWWRPMLIQQFWPKPTTYRFWGGHGQDLVIIARKHETRHQYVIIGTIQPQSNVVGNTPLNVTASILLEGVQLNFTVRRQGSTYLYSPAHSAVGQSVGAPASFAHAGPSMVQLDGWHEESHYSWWSNDFVLEAELHTAFQPADAVVGAAAAMPVQTQTPGWRAGDSMVDFTSARSYVSLGGDLDSDVPVSLVYEVEPRPVSRTEAREVRATFRSYRVEATMRSASAGCLAFRLVDEGVDIGTACVEPGTASERLGGEWQVVRVGGVVRLSTAVAHRVAMRAIHMTEAPSATVDVDLLRLVQVAEE